MWMNLIWQNARRITIGAAATKSSCGMWMAAYIAQGMKSAVKTWNVKCESDMSRVLKSKAHFKWCSFSVVVSLAWIMAMAFTAKFSPYAKKKERREKNDKTSKHNQKNSLSSWVFTSFHCLLAFISFVHCSFFFARAFFIHSRLRAPLATLSRLNLYSRVCGERQHNETTANLKLFWLHEVFLCFNQQTT